MCARRKRLREPPRGRRATACPLVGRRRPDPDDARYGTTVSVVVIACAPAVAVIVTVTVDAVAAVVNVSERICGGTGTVVVAGTVTSCGWSLVRLTVTGAVTPVDAVSVAIAFKIGRAHV